MRGAARSTHDVDGGEDRVHVVGVHGSHCCGVVCSGDGVACVSWWVCDVELEEDCRGQHKS